ncbi:TNF receptor-associated protein 1, mitochondrial [Ceratobasidium sp. UAMH 11750]|nr:TNF receptor-associated protein 1, mitochondrial [Ceratobasidium sp. UAMH 11750]
MLVTEGSYRLVMGQVKTLVEQGVPLVCLTATLPPSMMPDLRNVLGFPTFHVVRESTLRRNIVLRTALFATRAHALSALVRHVVKFRTELKPGEGIMVQCRFRAETERIAGMLTKATGVDTNFYHGGVNEWEKDEVAFRWIARRDAVIVCTSGLGSGVNHPSCRAVLHFGPPYGATDYAQEVGRSGRDGLPSLAILFAWQPLPPVDHPDVKGYSYLREAIETGDCIQYRLTRFLDGADLAATCASSGCLPCGPCKNDLAKAALRLAPALRNGSMGPSLELVVRSEQDWIEQHLPTVQTGQTSSATPTPRHPQYPQATATVLVPGPPTPPASPVRAGPASPSSGPPSLGPAPRGAPPDTSSSSSRAEIQSGDRREPSVGQTPRHPPADVGAQVRADAQNSKNRRQPGPHAAHEQNEDQEERHAPYSLPTLLRIKARYSECCPLCTLDRRAHRDHRLQDCPHWPGTKGTLEGMDIEGKAFSPCKRSSRLPGPNQLCFYCWWLLPSRHGHPNAPAPQGCSVPDNIPQLCWMAFRDPETRVELQAGLSVDASHFSSIDRYWAWIYASRRKVTYRGQTTTFLNAHAVYIYFHGVDF